MNTHFNTHRTASVDERTHEERDVCTMSCKTDEEDVEQTELLSQLELVEEPKHQVYAWNRTREVRR